MIIPLDKLLTVEENKYIFTRALMETIDRVGNIDNYSEDDTSWKIVPNILKLVLEDEVKYELTEDTKEE